MLKSMIPAALRSRIRQYARRRHGNSSYFSAEFLGHQLAVFDGDSLSVPWYGAGWTAQSRTEFGELQKLPIPRNGLIFDLGAHQGVVAILLRRMLVPSGRVVAVEIDPLNAGFCTKNIAKNNETNVICLNLAVSDRETVVAFDGGSNNCISTRSISLISETVETVTITRLAADYGIPDLVYCDIEGAEALAIKGAGDVLSRISHWFIELHGNEACLQYGSSQQEIIEAFEKAGFDISIAEAQCAEFVPISKPGKLIGTRCFILCRRPTS